MLSSVVFPAAGSAQERPDAQLLATIRATMAVDNHSHALPLRNPGATGATAADPLGTSPPFFSVRQRETNPEWIEAWRALYGYPHRDASAGHVRDAFSAKQRRMQDRGTDYPAWILDRAGIEFALINAPQLGPGQAGPRFRWVPYADGFLFPLPTNDPTVNVLQRRRAEAGLEKPIASWTDFLEAVRDRLAKWKAGGAVAIKFTIAYYRPLDFAPAAEADARDIYERYLEDGAAQPRDYRTADYRSLQDFLFRHVAREAGRAGLAVHVHTGEGGGPVFGVAGSDPLLLEAVVNDFSLSQTTFVLVHGGFPFDRAVRTLIQKPNVYADLSGQTFFHSRHDLGETLRLWLWAFPEKVLFGTDAFTSTQLRGWEEMTWLAARSGREALALALTRMMADGDITRLRAAEVARMVLRDNAIRLYKLAP
jgi:predicted TIM-barrel fold metal-dependent hydrolase